MNIISMLKDNTHTFGSSDLSSFLNFAHRRCILEFSLLIKLSLNNFCVDIILGLLIQSALDFNFVILRFAGHSCS